MGALMKNAREEKTVITARVELSATEYSAVEAWQQANAVASQSHALRELVRIGLLAEIRKIYEMAVKSREQADEKVSCSETL